MTLAAVATVAIVALVLALVALAGLVLLVRVLARLDRALTETAAAAAGHPGARHRVTAAAIPAGAVTASAPVSGDVALDARTITGLVVPWGAVGRTDAGSLTITAGALEIPDDISRVKLFLGHDRDRPIGRATALTETDAGLMATFQVSATADGDTALLEASDHVRDGLSFELSDAQLDEGRIVGARLDAVALVPLPAFADARVLSVTAQQHQGVTMTLELARQILADTDGTYSAAEIAAARGYLAHHDDATDDDRALAAAEDNGDTDGAESSDGGDQALAPTAVAASARVPSALTGNAGTRGRVTAAQGIDRLAGALRRSNDASQINAALADVVPGNDGGLGFVGTGQWLDEIWQATNTQRDFVDHFSRGTLTGFRVYGWRWVNKPEVGPWEGNKTEIPTNPVSTEPAEEKAKFLAGGWDVAREIVDLGDPSFLTAMFAAAAEDYARKVDDLFGAALLKQATTPPDPVADVFEAFDVAARALSMRGASLNALALSSDLWSEYINGTSSEVPWWLANQGAVNLSGVSSSVDGLPLVFANHALPAGTVLAGDRRAATFYEAAGSPLRVQAVNIPRGGIDISVHGYWAAIVNDPTALLKITVGGETPAPGAAAETEVMREIR